MSRALHCIAPRAGTPARRAPFPLSVRRHRGQALMLCLVLLFAGCLGLFFMFSTGRIAASRQRLDNAADAAAYSAALWRARVMNFHAYSNRAIVAEEVAIAQAVTLVSWARYFETFSANASVLATPFPPVATVLAAAADLARGNALVVEEAASEEIAARNAYKQLLATSQEVLQHAVDTFALGAVANEVARANDRRFFAFALPEDGEFTRMTRRYAAHERERLQGVVDASLDTFVAGPRGLDMTMVLMPSACFGNPFAGVDTWFHVLRKRGGTVMSPRFERWEAADTMSLHGYWPEDGFFGFEGCFDWEALPLGWGAAEAGRDVPTGALQADPGGVLENWSAASAAQAAMNGRNLPGFAAYSGTPEVRDLAYDTLADPRFPVSRVAVLARVGGDDVRTANVLDVGVGRLRLGENYAGRKLWSLSAAELYFRRPGGESARTEYASLFNPYWQVRLVEPSAAQRVLADGYVR